MRTPAQDITMAVLTELGRRKGFDALLDEIGEDRELYTEIEDAIAGKVSEVLIGEPTNDYQNAQRKWRDALETALNCASDGFKAPELNVEESVHVLAAAWELQIEYAALVRDGKRRRGEVGE